MSDEVKAQIKAAYNANGIVGAKVASYKLLGRMLSIVEILKL